MRQPQVTVIDVSVYTALTAQSKPAIRLTRIIRPLIVACTHRQVRRALRNIRRCMRDLFTMVSLLFIYIGVTTLAFFVLFQHRCAESAQCMSCRFAETDVGILLKGSSARAQRRAGLLC